MSVELKEDELQNTEVVGLDHAFIELRLQEDYISKKINKNGQANRLSQKYGLESMISDSSERARRHSITDGKQLIALAYGF